MNLFGLAWLSALLLLAPAAAAQTQTQTELQPQTPEAADPPAKPPALAQVTYDFERPGVPVPRYTLRVDQQGHGTYIADEVLQVAGARDGDPPQKQHVERPIELTAPTVAKIFTAALALDGFHAVCASSLKNIADTGAKTLTYTAPPGAPPGSDGACRYNFSENKSVVLLTETFGCIAMTLDIGRRLDFDHRFDRLGLDADMNRLMEAVGQGRAIELGTIARTLRVLAQDPEVMERVRLHAAALLAQFPPPA